VSVNADGRTHSRRTSPKLVGRRHDLALLEGVLARAVDGRCCHLVRVLGEAGVGKTRLIEEFVDRLGKRAMVLQGRCLSFGEGVSEWPVARMVRAAAGIIDDEPPDVSYAKLASLVGENAGVTSRLASVLGLREGTVEAEDTYRILLRFLEILAERRPLVVVIDDLHWAQPALIGLIQHVSQWSRDAPLMLVCCGRSDLPGEPYPDVYRNTLQLELPPLSAPQTQALVGYVLPEGGLAPELRARLAEAAAGIPLFVEMLLGMLLEDRTLRLVDGQWVVAGELADVRLPGSIHAVLAARLDELPEPERHLLGQAAVVGSHFRIAAVAALSPDRDPAEISDLLTALARRQLIHWDLGSEARRDTAGRFTFRHTLIREAAYQSLSKEARAELHQLYAEWLKTSREQEPEVDEMIGFHLEAVCRLRAELNHPDSATRELARTAGERLAAAGHALATRGDAPLTAADLLKRAVALLPDGHDRQVDTLLDLAAALRDAEHFGEALTVFARARDVAETMDDPRRAAHAALGHLDLLWFTQPSVLVDGGREAIDEAVQVLENANDDLGLAKALRLSAYVDFATGRTSNARKAVDRAIGIARYLRDEALEAQLLRLLCVILFWGPAPLAEVAAEIEKTLARARERSMRIVEAAALSTQARVAAMRGDFEAARENNKTARSIATEFSDGMTWAAGFISEGLVELFAGDLGAAERKLQHGYDRTREVGGAGPAASLAALLARTLLRLGRDEEALAMARACRNVSSRTQLDMRLKPRLVRAVVLARQGRLRAAERLARCVVAVAETSEQIDSQAEAWFDLAQVLDLAGDFERAREAAEQALLRSEAKGNEILRRAIGSYLAELGERGAT
jgi:tetratricopeptide (TPR) repeat protein